jgi:hypothetical protein
VGVRRVLLRSLSDPLPGARRAHQRWERALCRGGSMPARAAADGEDGAHPAVQPGASLPGALQDEQPQHGQWSATYVGPLGPGQHPGTAQGHSSVPGLESAASGGAAVAAPEAGVDPVPSMPHEASRAAPEETRRYLLSASTGACPSVYWLGGYSEGGCFDVQHAMGPLPLDWGDIAYAPNLLRDPYVSQGAPAGVQPETE